ncbi:hypothetical protein ACH5RR_039618 [Cinchona calisaya]|uniref:Reverse transcriptase zinc-binding domain-containing protein n=1 Tax=Cinchona calisaya TaxID=153742 RepID=A0ABD2Y1F7_9GENT
MWCGIDYEILDGDNKEEITYCTDEDDRLYEKGIDEEIEAVGWSTFKTAKTNKSKPVRKVIDEGIASGDESDSDYASVLCSFDKEGSSAAKKKFKELNPETDFEDTQFSIGLLFPSKDVLKKAIRMHGVNERRDVKLIKDGNDKLEPNVLTHTNGSNPNMIVFHLLFRVQKEKKLTVSKSQIEDNEIDRIQRIYICFDALKQGFVEGEDRFVVELPTRTCSCRKWQGEETIDHMLFSCPFTAAV